MFGGTIHYDLEGEVPSQTVARIHRDSYLGIFTYNIHIPSDSIIITNESHMLSPYYLCTYLNLDPYSYHLGIPFGSHQGSRSDQSGRAHPDEGLENVAVDGLVMDL